MFEWWRRLFGAEKRQPVSRWQVPPQPPVPAQASPRDNKMAPSRIFHSSAPPGIPLFREFYNSVSGVTFSNTDGRSRQEIIRRSVHAGMSLSLLLEDDNPIDKSAVALFTPNGQQIGYLSQSAAWDARDHIERGRFVQVTVSATTGGTSDRPTCGVNILVEILAAPVAPTIRTADFRKALIAAKRDGRHEEAEKLLLQDLDEREKPFGAIDTFVSSWSYEQLAVLYRSQKRWADEIAILTRYFSLPEGRRMAITDKLKHRRDKAASLKAASATGTSL